MNKQNMKITIKSVLTIALVYGLRIHRKCTKTSSAGLLATVSLRTFTIRIEGLRTKLASNTFPLQTHLQQWTRCVKGNSQCKHRFCNEVGKIRLGGGASSASDSKLIDCTVNLSKH